MIRTCQIIFQSGCTMSISISSVCECQLLPTSSTLSIIILYYSIILISYIITFNLTQSWYCSIIYIDNCVFSLKFITQFWAFLKIIRNTAYILEAQCASEALMIVIKIIEKFKSILQFRKLAHAYFNYMH